MIPKARRLSSSRVDYILRKGIKNGLSKYFSIRFVPTGKSENRFCVMVSTRINPKAVERNRLRRRIYEALKKSEQKGGQSYDIILITRNGATKLKMESLMQEINVLLNTIHEKK